VHTLSNGRIRLSVDPTRGGTITELVDDASGDQWFLNVPERRRGFPDNHPAYDDVWAGGFEELFPNDAPGKFDERELPDHGELWSGAFETLEASPARLRLRRTCTSVPAVIEKTIQLDAVSAAADISYKLTNRGAAPLWHLFKLHAAMRVEAADRLLLPGGVVSAVEPGFGTLSTHGPWEWPVAVERGKSVDLSTVRDVADRFKEFVYVSELPSGACGIRRTRTGHSFHIEYPQDVFPFCWLFITYGGWREYNTVVLEPCTNMPKDLEAARLAGSCAVLAAGEVKDFSIRIIVRAPHES
jgi:hypothetical protein